MTKNQTVATWVAFMLTAIMRRNNLTRTQIIELAQTSELIAFLFNNYELLHYYDNNYILDDAMRFVEKSGYGETDGLVAYG